MKHSYHFFFFLLLIAGCAGQRPPEGGPVDSIPPEIISVYPSPSTVNYSENKIIIEFSEYVDRRSAEEAVFISPNIEDKEFDWSGTELEITINEQLRSNTTYVVTIGTDVVDIRASNRMAKAFSVAFSTGNTIDNGTLVGKVFDEKSDGVMIFSYRLNTIKPDTLNPARSKPDYLTQTGKGGNFQLTNLASGNYRLFAIRDEFRNLLYDPETDAAGTTDDVTLTLTDTLFKGIQFTLAKEDTTPPRITSVIASDNRHILVQFSEELDSSSVHQNSFTVTDTLYQNTLPIQHYFLNNSEYNNFTLVTEKQKVDERYVVKVNGVKDKRGFVINPAADAKQFSGSSINDTIPPAIMYSTLQESSAKIFPDDKIDFQFNDILLLPLADTAVGMKRQKDSSSQTISLANKSPNSISIIPNSPLNIGEQYQLLFKWNAIRDLFENHLKDSVSTVNFSVVDPENTGSIEGIFAGFGGQSNIITAKNVNDLKQKELKTKTSSSGKFVFNRLPEGRYALKAFDDRNSNLQHDAGIVFPLIRAEHFTLYHDTIRVRPRWPIDGVIFKTK